MMSPLGTATAQDVPAGTASRPVIFGVSAGFSRASDGAVFTSGGLGYQMQASVESRPVLRVLSGRADAVFADWGPDRMAALTASAVLLPVPRVAVAPYLLAGGGAYTGPGQDVQPGWTVGAGFRVRTSARTAVSIESRVHAHRDGRRFNYAVPVQPELQGLLGRYRYVWQPLSVGVRF
jgi:long-subunit fatty acid transport protein